MHNALNAKTGLAAIVAANTNIDIYIDMFNKLQTKSWTDAFINECVATDKRYDICTLRLAKESHSLDNLTIVKAYSLGIKIEFDGVLDFDFNDKLKSTFADAIKNGISINKIFAKNEYLDDAMIKNLQNISHLDCTNNSTITSCNHLGNALKILVANGNSGIGDAGIASCKGIVELRCNRNTKITTCAQFARTLRKLHIRGYRTPNSIPSDKQILIKCGITDDSIKTCKYIEYLDCMGNNEITTCAPFANTLKVLVCNDVMTDEGVKLCDSIEKLHCRLYSSGKLLTTCDPFAVSLRTLDIDFGCGLRDASFKNCSNVKEFYCNNPHIKSCAAFANSLVKLELDRASCINDKGIEECVNIESLILRGNKYVSTLAPFAKTITKFYYDTIECLPIRTTDCPNLKPEYVFAHPLATDHNVCDDMVTYVEENPIWTRE